MRAIILALAGTVALRAGLAEDSHTREVDKLVSKVAQPDSPGCSVAIAQNGELVYKRATGMADLEHDVRLTPDSVFDIGSVSKEFTAASIILLAQARRLKLSDSVRKFIPELPPLYDPVTLADLIHHTAGVPDVLWLWALRRDGLGEMHVSRNEAEVHDGNGDFHYSVDDFLTLLGRVKALMFDPGDHFTYSNSNYILLSIVVQRASGKPLRDFAQERQIVRENLGTQTIEGFVAEGTRVTSKIAAGLVGNEQPLSISVETWYAPELRAVMLRKRSDPRSGDAIYRLTEIRRAEPDPSLFKIPPDFKLITGTDSTPAR